MYLPSVASEAPTFHSWIVRNGILRPRFVIFQRSARVTKRKELRAHQMLHVSHLKY